MSVAQPSDTEARREVRADVLKRAHTTAAALRNGRAVKWSDAASLITDLADLLEQRFTVVDAVAALLELPQARDGRAPMMVTRCALSVEDPVTGVKLSAKLGNCELERVIVALQALQGSLTDERARREASPSSPSGEVQP